MNIFISKGKTFGERSCFLAINLTSYCFYRDAEHRLAAIAMNGLVISQDKQMIIDSGILFYFE